jgi:hypothetical protein
MVVVIGISARIFSAASTLISGFSLLLSARLLVLFFLWFMAFPFPFLGGKAISGSTLAVQGLGFCKL